MAIVMLIARICFCTLFILSGVGHFSEGPIAAATASGVPMANILVPLSGIVELLGALSILLGYRAKWGAVLIVAFLLPVTFTMHPFWQFTDPMQAMIHQVMFMKNIALVGAALFIANFGSGQLSIDSRRYADAKELSLTRS